MDVRSTLTLLLAFYGALLSTFVFVMARLDQRSRIRTSVNLGFQVGLGASNANLLFLEAANVGRIDVTLASWSFRLPSKERLVCPWLSGQQVSFPHVLRPGQSCTVHVALREVLTALKSKGFGHSTKIVPEFTDQTGVVHKGKRLKLHKSWWAQT